MIQIKKEAGYTDRENPGAESFALSDGEQVLGRIVAVFARNGVDIISLSFENPMHKKMFSDGLIRSALNAADLRGIDAATSRSPELFDILAPYGFELCEGTTPFVKLQSISDFFAEGCESER